MRLFNRIIDISIRPAPPRAPEITAADKQAAARGLSMRVRRSSELQRLINIHGDSGLFASRVITAAARDELDAR